MKYDIVGVGDVAYDNLCIVENYPEEDGSTHILELHNQGGGCCGTALVTASRLGFSTAFIGNTGDDQIYLDYDIGHHKIDGTETATIEMYRMR